MKKILLLSGILVALLGLTWLLTESGQFDQSFEIEKKLQAALRNPTQYKLPQATLRYQDSHWQSSKGIVLRAELLDELHRSLESIKIHRVMKNPPERESFFTNNLIVHINELELQVGDMSPAMDSFYLSLKGDPDVYVMDLNELGSMAVGDNENVLRQAKYQRMTDLLKFPEHGWQETRLFYILRRSGFQLFAKAQIRLDPVLLSKRFWGSEVIKSFVAGLQSLEILGEIKDEKPLGINVIENWSLTQADGSVEEWQFFQHPQVDLIYVWIESLKKAFPLNEASSDLVKAFPERLIDKPTLMQLKAPEESLVFTPALGDAWARLLREFLETKQSYDLITIHPGCQSESGGVEMRINQIKYQLQRTMESWLIRDCESGIQWTYRLPKDSPLDFSLDSAKLVP